MTHDPGALMAAEIDQQPRVFTDLVARRAELAEVAARIEARRPR